MIHVGGYQEYSGECLVHWRDTIMYMRDSTINVGGYHEHIGDFQ